MYAPGGRKVSTGRATVSLWSAARARRRRDVAVLYRPGGRFRPSWLFRRAKSRPRCPGLARARAGRDVFRRGAGAAWPGPARRWPWLAFLSAAVAAGVAAVCFAAFSGGGPGGPASTWTETTGTPAHTWADPVQLTGAGTPLGPRQSVQVLCRVKGYVVQDGDPWWYRLASSPWNGRYYAGLDSTTERSLAIASRKAGR